MSDISVIIPAYNRAELIGETLRSLLNQTIPAKEIIVVDDGSTDGTAEAAKREFSVFRDQFSGRSNIQNPTFKILRHANAGPGAARNRGLKEATGEFIHFFDSDDIAAPNKHEVQLRALLETGADIAYGPWVMGRFMPPAYEFGCDTAKKGKHINIIQTKNWRFVPSGPVLQQTGIPTGCLTKALLTNWSIVPHACLFRRSIIDKVHGFPSHIHIGEDQLMFLRCLLVGAKVVHSLGTLELYRLGTENKLTMTGKPSSNRSLDYAFFLIDAQRDCLGKGFTDPANWFLFAHRAWKELQNLEVSESQGQTKVSPQSEAVKKNLLKICSNFPHHLLCIYDFLNQKQGGIKQRLGIPRVHPNAKSKWMSFEWCELFNEKT